MAVIFCDPISSEFLLSHRLSGTVVPHCPDFPPGNIARRWDVENKITTYSTDKSLNENTLFTIQAISEVGMAIQTGYRMLQQVL